MTEIKAGLTFRIPNQQVQDPDTGEWYSPIYRVNSVTRHGSVYYGILGEPKSMKMTGVSWFRLDLEAGRKVLWRPEE